MKQVILQPNVEIKDFNEMDAKIGNTVVLNFNGKEVKGKVTGIQNNMVIVKPEVWQYWMGGYHNANFDPEGCLCFHKSFVEQIVN